MESTSTRQNPQSYDVGYMYLHRLTLEYVSRLYQCLRPDQRRQRCNQGDCEVCRSYFPYSPTNHGSESRRLDSHGDELPVINGPLELDPEYFGHWPDPRVFQRDRRDTCYGCGTVCFLIMVLGYLMKTRDNTTIMNVTFNLERNENLEANPRYLYLHAYVQTPRYEHQIIYIRLEIFKMAATPQDSLIHQGLSWLQWLSCFSTNAKDTPDAGLPFFLQYAPQQNQISTNTGSREAFSRVFSWFRACCANHLACGNESDAPLLPTRVIDITKADQLALVESNGSRGHYLCLSHRWADPDHMPQCTLQNMASLKKHIPWTWLTTTFQDAITFARQFSEWYTSEYVGQVPIRYIWIDSLCIIQDSVEDWKKESQSMGAVYEGAILTVAAATGRNGCFVVADPVFKGFGISGLQHDNSRIHVREALNHDSINGTQFKAPISSLDLLNRGWVLQERLLSRRFVLFTPLEIMWECLESSDCECGFQQEPRTLGKHLINSREVSQSWKRIIKDDPNHPNGKIPYKIAYHRSLRSKSANKQRNLRNWWRRLVELHSTLNLTRDSDRIPAIAGLGSQLARFSGRSEPQFGHFLDALSLDLAWFVDPANMGEQTSMESVPSWSWAHCRNPVQMPGEDTGGPMKVHPEFLSSPSQHSPALRMRCCMFQGFSNKLDEPNSPLTRKYYPDNVSWSQITEKEPHYILLASTEQSANRWFLMHVKPINTEKAQFYRLGILEISLRDGFASESSTQLPDAKALMRACFISHKTMEIELV